MSNPKAPGLFLDRDGVINVTEPGVFVNRARDFRLGQLHAQRFPRVSPA